MAYQDGTEEERAAFPRKLFLYTFLRAWNTAEMRRAPDFIDRQLEEMESFDKHAPSPHPEAAVSRSHPKMRPRTPEPAPARNAPPPHTDAPPSQLPVGPPRHAWKVAEVVIPRRKFADISREGEEEREGRAPRHPKQQPKSDSEPEITPPPSHRKGKAKAVAVSPPPPIYRKGKAKAHDNTTPSPPRRPTKRRAKSEPESEPESDPEPRKASKPKSKANSQPPQHVPRCEKCVKGNRACLKSPNGGSCRACRKSKLRCEYAQRGKKKREEEEDDNDDDDGGVGGGGDDESVEEFPSPKAKGSRKAAEAPRIKKEPMRSQPSGKALRPRVKGRVELAVEEKEVKEGGESSKPIHTKS